MLKKNLSEDSTIDSSGDATTATRRVISPEIAMRQRPYATTVDDQVIVDQSVQNLFGKHQQWAMQQFKEKELRVQEVIYLKFLGRNFLRRGEM